MKTFPIRAFGKTFNVRAEKRSYDNGSLAVIITDNKDDEPFGVLTVNLEPYGASGQSATRAYVKSYSENSQWAQQALDALGAKDTGIRASSGFVTCPLYEFPENI